MKNILVLGGFGFIGTNIMKYVENTVNKYRFIVFDRFSKHLGGVLFKNISSVYSGDFSDEYVLNKIFDENKIDIVVHSISASVPATSVDNVFDLQFNVIPTIKLLDIMRKNEVKNIVFISSGGAVYGDIFCQGGHKENDVLFPKSAYGLSKLTIEKYFYLYSFQHSFKSLILRLSNPYGPYHYSQKQGVVNISLEKALKGECFEIWGTGEGRKDYIYVKDFCDILFKLLDFDYGQYAVINVGSGYLMSVNDIVSEIKMNYIHNFKFSYKQSNTLDVCSFELNLEKLKSFIGENYPFTTFKDGLRETYKWYK